jgi:galactokinase
VSAGELPARFEATFGQKPTILARAPGRVNLLGEHVDYNNGLALPCGIQFAALVGLRESSSGSIRLAALDLGAGHVFQVSDLEAPTAQLRANTPDWARYPVGVCWAWVNSGHRLPAFDAAYTCDVPSGAGLSSSAAIEVAFASALSSLQALDWSDIALARLCQSAEHTMAGVHSGLMDQWTSVSAVRDHALLLDFNNLSARPVPLPAQVSIVVADTGVPRALAASAYNQRVQECRQAVAELRRHRDGLGSLRDITLEEFGEMADHLPQPARMRAQHVVEEIERVRQGAKALEAGDATEFGKLMRASHVSLRDLFQVSGPELDKMVEIADQLDGAYGSRLTGAGFGGSTVSLVERDRAGGFCDQLARRYSAETGKRATTWVCQAGPGAHADVIQRGGRPNT